MEEVINKGKETVKKRHIVNNYYCYGCIVYALYAINQQQQTQSPDMRNVKQFKH